MITIDIGVACSGAQTQNFWSAFITQAIKETKRGSRNGYRLGGIHAATSAVPDHNKNKLLSDNPFAPLIENKRNNMVDANRVAIVQTFLGKKSDYIFWIDDDVVLPDMVLTNLLEHRRDFVAGLYFNSHPPNNPIAYMRNRVTGLYHPFYGYNKGAVVQVDSVGMGCTLIHRSVYEKVIKEHEVFERWNGSLYPVHKSAIYEDDPENTGPDWNVYFADGYIHTRARRMTDPEDSRPWPFYASEYGRTEDHHFCELTANVGIRPWVDTSIVCGHVKPYVYGDKEYLEQFAAKIETGEL